MGQQQSASLGERVQTRKQTEYKIFMKSFRLIEKYAKQKKGVQKMYQKEYNYAQSNNPKGYLNWRRVLPQELKGAKNNGYVEAIGIVAQLLREAHTNFAKQGTRNADDSRLFAEVYNEVQELIDYRQSELKAEMELCCLVIKKGEIYSQHEVVLNSWRHFADQLSVIVIR